MTDNASEGMASPASGPVMLALSTFRHSDAAIQTALDKAAQAGSLFVLYVADVNLARYLVATDLSVHPELKHMCEEELLELHRKRAAEKAEAIVKQAEGRGITATLHVETGRFGVVALAAVARVRPAMIVTTRSNRPEWVRRLFGSPVDRLIAEAGCPVLVV